MYLLAVAASIFATGFLQAPVSVHRALFRKHRRKETVLALWLVVPHVAGRADPS